MSDQVTVPGVGPTRKRYVYIAVAGVAGIVAFAYLRKRKASAAAAPTVDTTTGALAADGSYVNPAPVRSVDTTVDTSGGTAIITDANWVQAAIAQMPNWDPQYLQLALGAFVTNQPVDTNQANAIRAAEGLVGPPPMPHTIVLTTGGSTPGAPADQVTGSQQIVMFKQGDNLYDVLDPYFPGTAGDALVAARGLNPGLDSHIDFKPVPGPPGTTKPAILKTDLAIRVA